MYIVVYCVYFRFEKQKNLSKFNNEFSVNEILEYKKTLKLKRFDGSYAAMIKNNTNTSIILK